MIVYNAKTGEIVIEAEEWEDIKKNVDENQLPPTAEERIEALELALLEVVLNG